MSERINRPTNPYSPDWPAYWAQNPGIHKSIGAAADGGEGEGDGTGEGEGGQQTIDPAEFASLKAQAAKLAEENERLREGRREAQRHLKEQEKAAREAAEEAARKSGDVEALERSWTEKLTAREQELTGELSARDQMIHSLTVGATATSLAAKIAMDGCADGLAPHISQRLKSEIIDGKPVVKVLDKNGRPSAMTIDDLEKELRATPYLAPLIRGTKGSGAGHNGSGEGGQGGDAKQMPRSEFDKLDPARRAAFIRGGGKVVPG